MRNIDHGHTLYTYTTNTITYQQYINQRKHARIFTYYDPEILTLLKKHGYAWSDTRDRFT